MAFWVLIIYTAESLAVRKLQPWTPGNRWQSRRVLRGR